MTGKLSESDGVFGDDAWLNVRTRVIQCV